MFEYTDPATSTLQKYLPAPNSNFCRITFFKKPWIEFPYISMLLIHLSYSFKEQTFTWQLFQINNYYYQ